MKKKLAWIGLILSLVLMTAGCGTSEQSASDKKTKSAKTDKGTITIGYNNWAETIAIVNIWKPILEDRGYNVELKSTEKGPLYAGLSQGDVDVNMEVWLPSTDKPYVDKYKDKIVKHKAWYKNTTMGLAVPKYADIDSIEDLNDHKKEYGGKIVGIEPGASEMKITNKVLDEYNLNFDLVDSSGSAMTAELKKSYDKKKPIVVTLWEPHWAFARWDLKFLDDPKNVYGDPDKIYWFSREGFKKDFPEATKWFDQWHMSHKQLANLMDVMNKHQENPEKGAQKWLDNHQDLVKKWTKS